MPAGRCRHLGLLSLQHSEPDNDHHHAIDCGRCCNRVKLELKHHVVDGAELGVDRLHQLEHRISIGPNRLHETEYISTIPL